jgi:hypothetical protein
MFAFEILIMAPLPIQVNDDFFVSSGVMRKVRCITGRPFDLGVRSEEGCNYRPSPKFSMVFWLRNHRKTIGKWRFEWEKYRKTIGKP